MHTVLFCRKSFNVGLQSRQPRNDAQVAAAVAASMTAFAPASATCKASCNLCTHHNCCTYDQGPAWPRSLQGKEMV
jgi:hypothetical protein